MLEPWLVLALYVEEFTCDDVWLLRLSSSISLLGFCKNKRDTRLRPSQAEDRLKCTELGLMTKGLSQSLVILPTLWFHLFRQRLPPSYAASLWRDLAVLAPSMVIFHLSSGHSSTSALLWLKKKKPPWKKQLIEERVYFQVTVHHHWEVIIRSLKQQVTSTVKIREDKRMYAQNSKLLLLLYSLEPKAIEWGHLPQAASYHII